MISFESLAPSAAVAVDGRTGRPCQIRTGGQRLAISVLEAVRDETSAYPVDTGPRTVFVVRANDRRFRLVHLLGERRWTIEEIPPHGSALGRAA
jgi:hypothetical protein